MIPHVIHLCWFGRGDYPALAQRCIDSWKKNLQDYKIMLWNEDSFDVYSNEYTRAAYQQKKWAFVSDYVRLVALEQYGGIYMDTDLEVLRDFSTLLERGGYISSKVEGGLITAGFIATRAHHPYVQTLKKRYEGNACKKPNGEVEFLMNPLIFTKVAMEMYGYKIADEYQSFQEFTIYPLEYFMPYRKTILGKDPEKHSNYLLTNHSYAIHHDMGSWGNESKPARVKRALARLCLPRRTYLWMKEKMYKKKLSGRV